MNESDGSGMYEVWVLAGGTSDTDPSREYRQEYKTLYLAMREAKIAQRASAVYNVNVYGPDGKSLHDWWLDSIFVPQRP